MNSFRVIAISLGKWNTVYFLLFSIFAGLGLKLDNLMKDYGVNLLKWPEKVKEQMKEKIETKEYLEEYQSKKLETGQKMSDYVSHMMKDYLTSDNVWKIVTKSSEVSIFWPLKGQTITMWKFRHYSAIQILREINNSEYKTVNLTILEALYFELG